MTAQTVDWHLSFTEGRLKLDVRVSPHDAATYTMFAKYMISIGVVSLGVAYAFTYTYRSRYTLEINPEWSEISKKPKAVILNYTHRHYPNIVKAQHKSLHCLEERGYGISQAIPYSWNYSYDIDTMRTRPRGIHQGIPATLLRIIRIKPEEEFDIDEFLKACKECGAHTEIHRTTPPGPFSMNATKYVDKHEWAACYNDRNDLF
jgi:hypothetical protein